MRHFISQHLVVVECTSSFQDCSILCRQQPFPRYTPTICKSTAPCWSNQSLILDTTAQLLTIELPCRSQEVPFHIRLLLGYHTFNGRTLSCKLACSCSSWAPHSCSRLSLPIKQLRSAGNTRKFLAIKSSGWFGRGFANLPLAPHMQYVNINISYLIL